VAGDRRRFLVTEENDGWFNSQEELDAVFKECLDRAWDEPFDEAGWEALRRTNWRKDQNPGLTTPSMTCNKTCWSLGYLAAVLVRI
jgi:hypothetical protein